MGRITNTIANIIKPIIQEAIGSQQSAVQKAAPQTMKDRPAAIFDVPYNANLGYPFSGAMNTKMGGYTTFQTLRSFSENYDVARACINTRKRQISNLDWSIIPIDPKQKPDRYKRQIDVLTDFFSKPARNTTFKKFTDKIVEDLMVLDAVALWKDRTFGGELVELINVDGATIRLIVNEDGELPEEPDAAYQQIIKGNVYGSYTTEEMIYTMMNPRTNNVYGLSPLESLIIGVDTALRSQMYNGSLLSEGTVPEGFYGLPPEWTIDQIKEFQIWFDTLLAGNFQTNSRIKFMPGGTGNGYTPTKKSEDMKYLALEKWLLLKTCALFEVQPDAIGFTENVGVNTAPSQTNLGNQRGLIPMTKFLKDLFNQIIKDDFGIDDLKFEWLGLQVVDDDFELKRAETMLKNGAITIDEWRNDNGLEPFNIPATQRPMIIGMSGPMLLDDVKEGGSDQADQEDSEDPAAENKAPDKTDDQKQLEEMEKWETKSINYLKRGKGLPEFKAEYLDRTVQTLVKMRLMGVVTKDEVKAAFKPFKDDLKERVIITKAIGVKQEINDLKREKYASVGL